MSGRKYSVAEIDAMREALVKRETGKVYRPQFGNGPVPTSQVEAAYAAYERQFEEARHRAEDHLRTYMLAGVNPEDLAHAPRP